MNFKKKTKNAHLQYQHNMKNLYENVQLKNLYIILYVRIISVFYAVFDTETYVHRSSIWYNHL